MGRFDQLDSLRGLASLVVLITHCVLVCTSFSPLILYTPLYVLVSGPEAVIFFFILSGFVLSLSFIEGKKQTYRSYLVRRIFRIYLPFLVSITITLLLCNILFRGGVGISDWASGKWVEKADFYTYLQQINILSDHETTSFNPVVWSLIHEMRISIIFPLLMILINRLDWKISIMIALCCSAIGGANLVFEFEESLGYQTSWFYSLHYTSMFIIGALLAKQRSYLQRKFMLLKLSHKILLLFIAFLGYTYSRGVSIESLPFSKAVSDWGIAIGVSIVIIAAISSTRFSNLLNWKPISFFGKISYSLYLFHATVLFTFVSLLDKYLSTWSLVLMSLIPLILISFLSWKWLEVPSIKIGKLIGKRRVMKEASLIENNLT
ncbi:MULTISPECIES: acyltransferase [unclassified Paenibacillus]|uniref:acyltransferase family protein n=1 Tax=unclassified Paenibacillus TaxID=185978 RepID=UPI0016435EE9|nr:acyltransferase [Paenibacillus sp. Y412MC10]